MPERKFGSEALEASAKLRISSIDCLSAASFEAARSEQLRLPAEGPLKRRDDSSCKNGLTLLRGSCSSRMLLGIDWVSELVKFTTL